MKDYIKLLKQTGKALNKLRDEELKADAHPSNAINALQSSFLYAIASQQLSETSGLVDFQKYMMKLKNL